MKSACIFVGAVAPVVCLFWGDLVAWIPTVAFRNRRRKSGGTPHPLPPGPRQLSPSPIANPLPPSSELPAPAPLAHMPAADGQGLGKQPAPVVESFTTNPLLSVMLVPVHGWRWGDGLRQAIPCMVVLGRRASANKVPTCWCQSKGGAGETGFGKLSLARWRWEDGLRQARWEDGLRQAIPGMAALGRRASASPTLFGGWGWMVDSQHVCGGV